MNGFKDKLNEEDIFVESESSNTSIVNVESIVKSNNKNNLLIVSYTHTLHLTIIKDYIHINYPSQFIN